MGILREPSSAQRVRWMKEELDPPGEIPTMIDYINSPGGEANNGIRSAYRGAGFYSSFVIDCDGTVIDNRPWAWCVAAACSAARLPARWRMIHTT